MKRILLAGLVALLALQTVPTRAADKWTRVQSKNFTLVGNASESQIREVAEGLEVFRSAFSRFFRLKEGATVATTVLVFRSDAAFKPFKPLYQGKPANVAGFFQGGSDLNIIALAADMETPRVIYHELVHRIMSDNLGSQPPWFQEGFAECFSTLEIEGKDKKVRLGRAIGEHVELLNQRRFMPLEQLFSVAHGSPEYNEEEKQGLFYAESWAFVHYMMFNSEQRRTQLNTFLGELARGTAAPKAFQQVFSIELPVFQKEFEAYIQGRQAWNLFQIQTPAGLDRSKDMQAQVISEGEAESYLGDLLVRLNRLPEAETHLTKAIQLDPKLSGPQAAMGRLHLRKGNRAEALTYAKKASELDPDNYLAHYSYASLIRNQKEAPSDSDREILRRELKRTIELAPQFVEATEMLASENLSRNIEIVETIELLAKALAIAPGRDYVALQLASALSRTQQRESARPLLQNLLVRPGLEPPLRQNAQSLLTFLDRAAAADNASREFAERNRALADQLAGNANRETGLASPVATNTATPEIRRNTPVPAESNGPVPVQRNVEALAPGTARIRGMLTLLDCSKGVTFSVVVDGKTVKLHSPTPNEIKFTSFNSAVTGTVACGPLPGRGVPAVIVYRAQESEGSIGNPLTVDFVESLDSSTQNRSGLPAIPGTQVVRGFLTAVECSNGVTLTLTSEGKTLQLRSNNATAVAFLNGPNTDGTVDCTRLPGSGLPVAIVYRPSNSAGMLGEPVIVQFQRN
jgi:tetratricopeptide (TPR) repeat protein